MVLVAWLINQSINQSVFRVIFMHSVSSMCLPLGSDTHGPE